MSKGARIVARGKLGQTPLHQAAYQGHKEAAICLLDHGADVNAKNKLGFTPLSSAAQEGHVPLVDLLVLRGAVVDQPANDGVTALGLSSFNGHLEVVSWSQYQPSHCDGAFSLAQCCSGRSSQCRQAIGEEGG
jgi:ankyrin repeat protein